MLEQNQDLLSDSVIDIEEWNELVSSRTFYKLTEAISRRIEKYRKESEKLALAPTLDNQFKITAALNRKDELQGLLNKFNFYIEQYRLYQIKKQKGE